MTEEIRLLRGEQQKQKPLSPPPGLDIDEDSLHWRVTNGIRTYRKDLVSSTSPLHWKALEPWAFEVQIGSFCLPWEQAQDEADLWWTHHPEWEVFQETDRGYCFRPRPDPTQREFLTQVYQHQFHHHLIQYNDVLNVTSTTSKYSGDRQQPHIVCPSVFAPKTWNSGWSADIGNMVDTLRYSMVAANQPWQLTLDPWHYAAPDQAHRGNPTPTKPACPQQNFLCYFLPLSPCPLQHKHNTQYNYMKDPPRQTQKSTWMRNFVVRPQTSLRHAFYKWVREQTSNTSALAFQTPCTVMHVRRGDVLQHGNQSRRYHSIPEYLNVTTGDPDAHGAFDRYNPAASKDFRLHSNILLLTDDASAVAEVQKLHNQHNSSVSDARQDYHWMILDRPRWKADEGGWERQLPSGDPILEMTVLLGTFQLVQNCQSLVYSDSGFARWLLYSMQEKGHTDTSQAVGHYNIDEGNSYEWGTHNAITKDLSTSFQH